MNIIPNKEREQKRIDVSLKALELGSKTNPKGDPEKTKRLLNKTLDYTALLSESLIGFDEENGLPLFRFIDDEVVPLIADKHNWFKANYTSEAKVTSNDWI